MGVSGQRHWQASQHRYTLDKVGPRAGLDTEARRTILCLCQGSNPGVCSQTLYWLNYPKLLFSLQDGSKICDERSLEFVGIQHKNKTAEYSTCWPIGEKHWSNRNLETLQIYIFAKFTGSLNSELRFHLTSVRNNHIGKITTFWNTAPCSVVEVNRRWVIPLMMEAVNITETSVNFYDTTGAVSDKTIIVILADLITWNEPCGKTKCWRMYHIKIYRKYTNFLLSCRWNELPNVRRKHSQNSGMKKCY
jgi:hypothetical protein